MTTSIHRAPNSNGAAAQRGFTLLEVLLAMAISASAVVAVGMTFEATLRAKATVDNLANSTAVGPRVMSLIERDLAGLWHYNVKDNRIFLGRNMDIGGIEADRLDFLTTTDAIGAIVDRDDREHHPSVCEVGYWLRPHPRYPELIELWRREDPMVDDDLVRGGRFQLVSDRLKEFKIRYYDTVGYEAEERFDWDSTEQDSLPRRIKIEFVVEPLRTNRNEEAAFEVGNLERAEHRFIRHIVLDQRYMDVLHGGVAMKPVIPGPPEAATGGEGGGGGGGGVTGSSLNEMGGRSGDGSDPRGRAPDGGFGEVGRGRGGQGQGAPQGIPGGQPGGLGGQGTLPPGFDLNDLLRGGFGGR